MVLYSYLFYQFLLMYNKTYDYPTYTERFSIFSQNMDYIEAFHHRNASLVTLGPTPFADLTPVEFLEWLGLVPLPPPEEFTDICIDIDTTDVLPPPSLDWRENAFSPVSPVKDQGRCGSCWAFACAETAESAYALKNHTAPPVLSTQQLVDCSKEDSYGCSGGSINPTMSYILTHGLETEDAYPYLGQESGRCTEADNTTTIPRYTLERCFNVQAYSEEQLKRALTAYGPLVVCIDASAMVFQLYQSGIIRASECETSINHAVQLVGYGEEKGTKYWLVRNSWGETWGEKGYMRLERTDNENTEGTCGVALKAVGLV
jgi:C1A family cysteine protease